MDSKKLALKLAQLALIKKAEDVKILDLRNLTTISDFFVICTAHSEPQVKAVANEILEGAKKEGELVWHKEGANMKQWFLLDFVDVVVHIFLKETRAFYSLEKLWGDAPVTDVSDETPLGKLAKKTRVHREIKPKTAKSKSAKPKKAKSANTKPAKTKSKTVSKTTSIAKKRIVKKK